MSYQQKKDYFWCSFEAPQGKSITIQYVVLACQFVIFIMLFYAHMKAKRQDQFERISVVYKLIVIWLICFSLKTIVNVIAYFAYIEESPSNIGNRQSQDGQDEIDFTGLRVLSSIFFLLDSITTFFLQIAMIYIPYLWQKFTKTRMKNALQLLSDENLLVQDRIKINRISWFLNLVRKYLIIRNIYMIYFITVAIIVIISDSFKQFNKYKLLISIIQSIVILFVYPLGLWTFNLIKKNISLNTKQTKSMLIEFLILLICNAVRIILNSIFYFSNLVHYRPDKYCYDDHEPRQTTINCLYLSFGLSLMHILPGVMILYVYWPSKRDKSDFKNSLLISQTRIS